MSDPGGPTDLEQMLERIGIARSGGDQRVTMEDIIAEVGRRSFGPLLLMPGLIILLPIIGDIPGVPTLMATVVLLVAGQLLLCRDYFWLPNFILKRAIARDKLDRSLTLMRPFARFMDQFLRPRLMIFTQGMGVYAIAIASIVIALALPFMEFVPFTANGAGLALTLFGLALIANDGLLAAVAFTFTAFTLWGVIWLGVS